MIRVIDITTVFWSGRPSNWEDIEFLAGPNSKLPDRKIQITELILRAAARCCLLSIIPGPRVQGFRTCEACEAIRSQEPRSSNLCGLQTC